MDVGEVQDFEGGGGLWGGEDNGLVCGLPVLIKAGHWLQRIIDITQIKRLVEPISTNALTYPTLFQQTPHSSLNRQRRQLLSYILAKLLGVIYKYIAT